MPGSKTFLLDPKLIRHYRERQGITQTKVALSFDTTTDRSPEKVRSLVTSYQKMERTGKTTRKRAAKLAEILGVPLECMLPTSEVKEAQGIGPLFSAIKHAVRKVLSDPDKKLMQKLSERSDPESGALSYDEWLLSLFKKGDADEASLEIGRFVERLSLTTERHDIDGLLDILEIEEQAKRAFIYIDGLFFIQTSDHISYGQEVARVIQGVFMGNQVMDEIANKSGRVALRATLSRPKVIYRINFEHEFSVHDWWIEIARCAPTLDGNGIRFDILSELDDFILRGQLERLARSWAWELVGFSRPTPPVETMKIKITERKIQPTVGYIGKSIFIDGSHPISEIPSSKFEPRSQGGLGNRRAWHMEYNLIKPLEDFISELISRPGSWKVMDLSSELTLEHTSSDWALTRYSVNLVSQESDGSVSPYPWPKPVCKKMTDFIEKRIARRHTE